MSRISVERHEKDFTEHHYSEILQCAAEYYAFEPIGSKCQKPHVLWRHDVDVSPHRALALARLEAAEGVTSTYFLMLHSRFYNLLEREVVDLFESVAALGHRFGLHFDMAFDPADDREQLEQSIAYEKQMVEDLFGRPVNAISFHDPAVSGALDLEADLIADLVNVYGPTLRTNYEYVSDSNGYWRFDRLYDVVAERRSDSLHVLTHPEWWQEEQLSPRARIERCVSQRAQRNGERYDEQLEQYGRLNLGRS